MQHDYFHKKDTVCEIKIFDLWPLLTPPLARGCVCGQNIWWGRSGWGKTMTLPCLSTGTWQSWSIVRKLLNIKALMKCEDHHTKKTNIVLPYLFIHYFERVSQLAHKLFYLAALYKYLYTYIQ